MEGFTTDLRAPSLCHLREGISQPRREDSIPAGLEISERLCRHQQVDSAIILLLPLVGLPALQAFIPHDQEGKDCDFQRDWFVRAGYGLPCLVKSAFIAIFAQV